VAEQVIAIAFDKESRADEALLTLVHLQQEHNIELGDAVVVKRNAEGKVRLHQTMDITPERGALTVGWWGFFLGLVIAGPIGGLVEGVAGGAIGAVIGKLVDRGLNDDWIKETAQRLTPGTSALFLLINSVNRDVALKELSRFEGSVLYSDVPDDFRAEIQAALRDKEIQPTIH
jgi:uncharacterized membrane protein